MIIGNPYKFAFIVDIVPEWNDATIISPYVQGVLFLCINGRLFPSVLDTTTLSSDLFVFFETNKASPALTTFPTNIEFFHDEKKEAFIKMFNLAYPGCLNPEIDLNDPDVNNDYTYKVSNSTMEDNNSYVFAVGHENHIRIIGGEVKFSNKEDGGNNYFLTGDVSDIILKKKELTDYIFSLKNYYNECIKNK